MKILALDVGDKWVGSAISDPLGITCKPYKTVQFDELLDFLKQTLGKENIKTVVIGNPITMKGTQSQQTKKIIQTKEELESYFTSSFAKAMADRSEDKSKDKEEFKNIKWILWDERLSSKRAELRLGKKLKSKEAKIKSHSIAAAFILQSYLDYVQIQNN